MDGCGPGGAAAGFVCPATVATVDAWKLGQLRPGDRVRFVPITHEHAIEMLRVREHSLMNGNAEANGATTRRPNASGAVMHANPGDDARPALTIRRAGDRYVLVEMGENRLDLDLRVRVHALQTALARELGEHAELTPGIRSLQVRFDPIATDLDALVMAIIEAEGRIPDGSELTIPSRVVHLPLAWNDSQTQPARPLPCCSRE